MRKKSIISSFLLFFFAGTVIAQRPQFSFSTDVDLQRSLKKEQQFWAVGQTIQGLFNFSPKDGAYCWLSFYTDGKFSNNITATAKLTATTPQQVTYINNALMRFKQISLGWRHYLKGSYNASTSWNLYGYAGFGIILGRVINAQSITVDTTVYQVPVYSGRANFKRLTFDLGLGYEIPLGADIFLYNETRLWIPTSDYPSPYIFINQHAPLVASFNLGIRILFD